jgi:AraC-like DNA-binding protein
MKNRSPNTYHWLVDRIETDRNLEMTQLHLSEEGLELRMERWAFGQYAAVDMTYADTKAPFTFVPADAAHGVSERTISFQTTISGHIDGTLPSGHQFVLNKEWGLLTDYHDGSAAFVINPGEIVRSIGGVLSIAQISQLFTEEAYRRNLAEIIDNCGIVKSYRVTPAMRMVAKNAIDVPLLGPLKRLYLEGAALQMFALILDQSLEQPFSADMASSRMSANKKSIMDVAERLLSDLANPPTLIELSEYSGLSIYKINSGLKQYFGNTAFELLTRRRLDAARELLEENPRLSLKVLAHDLGYAHLSNFVTAFKREFGVTPGQYAKKSNNHHKSLVSGII